MSRRHDLTDSYNVLCRALTMVVLEGAFDTTYIMFHQIVFDPSSKLAEHGSA